MPDIFVSYAHKDMQQVRQVVANLAASGYECWMDTRSLTGGHLWTEEISRAIESSRVLLFFLSANSAGSDNVRRELQLAFDKRRRVIIVRLDETQVPLHLQYVLAGIQWIDFNNPELHSYLQKALESDSSSPRKAPAPAGPTPEQLFAEATRLNVTGYAEKALQLYRRVKGMDPYYPDIDLRIRQLENEISSGYVDKDGRISEQRYLRTPVQSPRKSASGLVAIVGVILVVACLTIALLAGPAVIRAILKTSTPPVNETAIATNSSPVTTVSASATPTLASLPTTMGPWTGQEGRLELTVDKVELIEPVGDRKILRFYLTVNNQSTSTLTLPLFGNFLAIDSSGQTYKPEHQSSNWPREIPSGLLITGSIDLMDPVPNSVSTMSIHFSTIYGAVEFVGKDITVSGIELP